MSDERTIGIYDKQADEYGEMTREMGEFSELQAFAVALPKDAHILDIGCGPGFYAAWLAQQGFTVDATDAAEAMVEMADAHPGVTAWQAQFADLDASAVYDGIWANFSLLHAKRADMPDLLARIHRALKPGGLFHIGMKLGEGEGPDRIGRFYAYYSEEELDALLAKAGFTPTQFNKGQGKGMDGSMARYITVLSHG